MGSVSADHPSARRRAGKLAKARDELALGQWTGGLGENGSLPAVMTIVITQGAGEVLSRRAGPEDVDRRLGWDRPGDPLEERAPMRETISVDEVGHRTAAPVPNGRIVPHAAGRAVMVGDVRDQGLKHSRPGPAGDDGSIAIEPDEGGLRRMARARTRLRLEAIDRRRLAAGRARQRAHAGPR